MNEVRRVETQRSKMYVSPMTPIDPSIQTLRNSPFGVKTSVGDSSRSRVPLDDLDLCDRRKPPILGEHMGVSRYITKKVRVTSLREGYLP